MQQLSELNPEFVIGTAEHAAELTTDRWRRVGDALQWLTFAHLPDALKRFSEPFYMTAWGLLKEIPTDSEELVTALNKLIEAKDSAMRAGIRNDTGRAGSVPRPQSITEPPRLS